MLITGLVLVFATTGCIKPEKLPTIDETLPASYEEHPLPGPFSYMIKDVDRGVAWIRCIDCNLDWHGISDHLTTTLGQHDFRDSTAEWQDVLLQESQFPAEHYTKTFRIYSSKSDYGHIMVINLAYLRTFDSQSVGTSGDYLIMAGYDVIDLYK